MSQQTTEKESSNTPITRRRFLTGTGASVLAFSVAQPEWVSGAEANARVNIGLIGAGGRGQWIADLFQKHGGYNLVAVADYFQDRVDQVGEKHRISSDKRYTGLHGYRKLLEQKLDAVIIKSPPYFHPEQAAAAVEAGKHVYLAKPIAVDVPGCVSIEASGKKATAKNLSFLVDFQTRANKVYQEAIQRIHAGELGKTILVEASYQCNLMFENLDADVRRDPKNSELRLRAWAIDRVLSGDVITEQNIHSLDVASWMINAQPIRAYGTGGRTREFIGDCWDRFAVIFYYPNEVIVSFNSRQAGFGYDDIMCRFYGLEGTVDTHYAGKVTVHARDFRSDGDSGNLYQDGAVVNIATFHESIVKGDHTNSTVAPSVRSNLTTILGRTAAYKNTLVTWDQMMQAHEKWAADLKGLKS
jgi:predicted dehydrogenase